jgi:hypothetical protein
MRFSAGVEMPYSLTGPGLALHFVVQVVPWSEACKTQWRVGHAAIGRAPRPFYLLFHKLRKRLLLFVRTAHPWRRLQTANATQEYNSLGGFWSALSR